MISDMAEPVNTYIALMNKLRELHELITYS